MTADLIVIGTIYDGINSPKPPRMLAVKDGIFCYVGSEEQFNDYLGKHTKVIRLSQGCLLPGLFEGHAHVTSGIQLIRGIELNNLNSPSEYVGAISTYIKLHPEEEFISGRGFINSHFGSEGPTAKLLDGITKEKYILLNSEDCHSSWVNTKVLEAAGITEDTEEVENGVIVRYENSKLPTGWLKEKEMHHVAKLLPKTSLAEYKKIILSYQEIALSHGLTAVYEPIMNDTDDCAIRVQAYHELDLENKLVMQFRVGITLNPHDDCTLLNEIAKWRQQTMGSHFEIIGIKVFLDGVVEGHTAFLREPYADQPGDCGHNMWDQTNLNELFIIAAGLDLSVHVHVIGDAAIDSALQAFEKALQTVGKKDLRNCITHLQIMQEDQFKGFQEMDLIAVTNPFWHCKNPAYYDELEVPYLGLLRAEKEYPMQSFFRRDIIVTQASDWPVSHSFHPFLGMEIAVTRREKGNVMMEPLNPKEAVTIEQMLKAITFNGAFQLKLEKVMGSIEIGKKANFIILDKDILALPPEEISEVTVLRNYIDGKSIYENRNECKLALS